MAREHVIKVSGLELVLKSVAEVSHPTPYRKAGLVIVTLDKEPDFRSAPLKASHRTDHHSVSWWEDRLEIFVLRVSQKWLFEERTLLQRLSTSFTGSFSFS